MQARIRGLVRASVAVVVLAATSGAYAQLFPKEKVRDLFMELTGAPVILNTFFDDRWFGLWSDVTEGIPEGWRYEGEERDGKMVYSVDEVPKARFEGEYRDGKPHGPFVVTGDSAYMEIEYRDGKLHGPFVLTGGFSAEGAFRDGKRHGRFLVVGETDGGGTRIEGELRDGVPVEGTVTITMPNGMVLRY